MISGPLIISISFAYLGLLFGIAYWADLRADQGRSVIAHPTIYALSLAVYCTAWTFYGSVGRAAASGLGFLPIYLGPTLVALLWGSLLLKMVRISRTQRITSIADFVASRYGKSHRLSGLVTIIAVVGVVPYIALQLKAIARSFTILIEYPAIRMPDTGTSLPIWQDTGFAVALLLAAFTILFGTRHLDASERHEGMVAAIAFESIVKLAAFVAVGLFVTLGVYGGLTEEFDVGRIQHLGEALMEPMITAYDDWFAISMLAALAVMMLPRQFQVSVVENSDEKHISRAMWLFPLYLLLINLFVIPIALAGRLTFPEGGVDADTFVLTIPMAYGQQGLALFVFIGGLSAATGMVIVETIALSTMVSNDLTMPLLLRHWQGLPETADMGRMLLSIRRAAIIAILLLGYLYYRLAGDAYALVSIGLISFAALAQLAPALIGGLYWRGGTRIGALSGLTVGFSLWAYTLLLPSFSKSGWMPAAFLDPGPFGIELLKPQSLFGLSGWSEITHCLFWSLSANLICYLVVSSLRPPTAAEAAQASVFVDALKHRPPSGLPLWRGSTEVAELIELAERFLGDARARVAFGRYAASRGIDSPETLPADAATVHFAEILLAGAIGSASARVMVASVAEEEPLGLDEVLDILDEASQIRAYSHKLEQKSRELERATGDLAAANLRLQELDRMKDDFVSSVTHELRTPLASIRAFSEILLDNPDIEPGERERFLTILVSETERLSRLVSQVLDLAKIESGQADWQNEEVDLKVIVEHAARSTEQLFVDKGATQILEVPNAPAIVLGDEDRLVQVVVNLLSNAAKFVPISRGQVTVRLASCDGAFRISVTDNGPGIPEQDLPVIFKKFRQSSFAKEKPVGTGLGLPISRKIVENLGGRIWAESSPGKGATLSFELPAHRTPSAD